MEKTYIQLFNNCGLKVDEIEVDTTNGMDAMDTLFNSGWILCEGDTIKVVKEYSEF